MGRGMARTRANSARAQKGARTRAMKQAVINTQRRMEGEGKAPAIAEQRRRYSLWRDIDARHANRIAQNHGENLGCSSGFRRFHISRWIIIYL